VTHHIAGTMDQIEYQLPLRLVPRKGAAWFQLVFFLFFLAATIAIFVFNFILLSKPGQPANAQFLYLAFAIPFLVAAYIGICTAARKLVPGSPLYNIELDVEGIRIRKGRRITRFAWTEITPLLAVEKTDNESHKIHRVIALRAADEDKLRYATERSNRAVIQIRAEEYAAGDPADINAQLADWLNDIRTAMMAERRPAATVMVPVAFHETAFEIEDGPLPAAATPVKAGRVIER